MKKFFVGLVIAAGIPAIVVSGLLVSGKVSTSDLKYVGQLIQDRGIVHVYYELKGMLSGLTGDFEIPSYDKQKVEGRGNSPWVIRTNLDKKTRMINFALAPELWVSYDTQNVSLYQLWKGQIDFQGAVYDGLHGMQPWSEGKAYIRNEDKTWYLLGDEGPIEAKVKYLGHVYGEENKTAFMRYHLSASVDNKDVELTLREQPEVINDAGQTIFERAFTIEENVDDMRAQLKLSESAQAIEREINGVAHVESFVILTTETTSIRFKLKEANVAIAEPEIKDEFKEPGQKLMDGSDCASCHHQAEQVVGPSYDAIATRYKDDDKNKTVKDLAKKIIDGSQGNWGSMMMVPHPGMSQGDAETIAAFILENRSDGYEEPDTTPRVSGEVTGYSVGERLETVHPNFSLKKIRTEAFKPKVGALDVMDDGRLLVATWDTDGAVFIVEDYRGDNDKVKIKRIAEGLQEPLGLKVVDGRIFVLQKQELTELVDKDGDEIVDEYRNLNNAWGTSSNFHEFAFGLVEKDGYLYANLGICVLSGGKSCNNQLWDRGHVIKVSIDSGELERFAFGLRAPNGIGLGPDDEIFVTDNQGDWLPSSKLMHVQEKAFFGSRIGKMKATENYPVTQPVVWMPQNEIGNSPTQPSLLNIGPYKNQLMYGDIYHGGIKRVFLDKVAGAYQGALFRFSDGFEGGVNRIIPNHLNEAGEYFIGEIGNPGNWQDVGKYWYGLELMTYKGNSTFEILEMRATPEGFQLVFTRPLKEMEITADHFLMQQWGYEPSYEYGGPKVDLENLTAEEVRVSEDRQSVFLKVPGLAPLKVVYLQMSKDITSQMGESLWINEAWYTLNVIPSAEGFEYHQPEAFDGGDVESALNTLTPEEIEEGWELLFNGQDLAGWRLYGDKSEDTGEWIVEDGAMKLNRDKNDLLMLFGADNIMYAKEPLENFELKLEWKISKKGNSGIFYGVNLAEEGIYWDNALEMQVLDNDGHLDGNIKKHRAGDLYDLKASSHEPVKPHGHWNAIKIVVNGDNIQHWMNGEKVVDVMRKGPEWDAMLEDSKFSGNSDFGQNRVGYLLFQDHSDIVSYRNIKVKKL